MDYDKYKLHRVGDNTNLSDMQKKDLRLQKGANQDTGLYNTNTGNRMKNIDNLGANLGLVKKDDPNSKVDYSKLAKEVGMDNIDPQNIDYEELEKRLQDIQKYKLAEEQAMNNVQASGSKGNFVTGIKEGFRASRSHSNYVPKEKAHALNYNKLTDLPPSLAQKNANIQAKEDVKDDAKEETKEAAKEAVDNKKVVVKKAVRQKTEEAKAVVKKKAIAFIIKNPWVIAIAFGLLLLLIIIIIVFSIIMNDDEVKKYDSTCDFNLTMVNLVRCNPTDPKSISLEEYVIDVTKYYDKEYSFSKEQLKALMVIIKTNTLAHGDYNNLTKQIDNAIYCTFGKSSEEEEERYKEIYEDVSDYLYIDESYSGTITELDSSSELPLDDYLTVLKDNTGSFSSTLYNMYNGQNNNLKLYTLEDNCEYTMVDANSLLYSDVCGGISLTNTSLSKSDYVALMQKYYSDKTGFGRVQMKENAGTLYDLAIKNDFNPELIPIRAELEGFSPGGTTYNYYGIGCANGAGVGACRKYDSFSSGALAYIGLVKSYGVDNLLDVYYKKHYAYIGSNWIKGNSADGGCYYFPYIKQYMSSERASEVEKACSSGNAIPTNDEDQLAYSKWQIQSSVDQRKAIFNIEGENCEEGYSGSCTLYSQYDPNWTNVPLGNSSYLMGGYGCAVTALAIGISCSGTEITIPDFDAGKFIKALNSGGCFTGDGDIYWSCSTISKVAPSVSYVGSVWVSDLRTQDKIDQIKKYSGNYIILLQYSNASTNGHYVVYSSIQGNKFSVKNPAGGKISEVPINDVNQMVIYSY